MKRFSQHGIYNPVAEINIIPLMDLVFNLLIVFMLATPLLENSMNIKMAPVSSNTPIDSKDITAVNLDSTGNIFLDKKPITLAALEAEMKEQIRKDPQHAVIVRGDEKVPYGKFVEIVDHLKQAGVTKLGIMGIAPK